MNALKPISSVLGADVEPLQSRRSLRKWPISYRSVGIIAMMSDVVVILLCGTASGILYHLEAFGITDVIPQYFGASAVVAAFYVLVMKGYDFYSPSELLFLRSQISGVTSTWLGVFLFLSGAVFALKIGDNFSRGATFLFASTGLAVLIVERVFYRALLTRGLNGQRFAGRNVVLITDNLPVSESTLIPTLLKHGFRLVHRFALPLQQHGAKRQEEFVSEIVTYLRGSKVEEVMLSIDVMRIGDLKKLLSALRALPLPVNFVPVGVASEILRQPSHILGDSVCIELQRAPLSTFERGLKRSIDVFGALTGLILLLPFLAITAVCIKLDSPGPIFFRQKRRGFNGRPFDIFKFRTMSVLEDGSIINQATQFDGRVTRLGKRLRRTSIDELPQLLNVLNGSMSLVGPRPHAVAHDNHFDKIVGNYAFRHHVKPGLTGWAQVNGHRGPTPTAAEIRHRVEYDLWYIDHWSLRLDIFIIFRTFFEVMRGRNAY